MTVSLSILGYQPYDSVFVLLFGFRQLGPFDPIHGGRFLPGLAVRGGGFSTSSSHTSGTYG